MTLHEFNTLSKEQVREELFKCCGSKSWVEKMLPFVPAEDMVELLEDAEEQWWKCSEEDWKEAFTQHPKIKAVTFAAEKEFYIVGAIESDSKLVTGKAQLSDDELG